LKAAQNTIEAVFDWIKNLHISFRRSHPLFDLTAEHPYFAGKIAG